MTELIAHPKMVCSGLLEGSGLGFPSKFFNRTFEIQNLLRTVIRLHSAIALVNDFVFDFMVGCLN